MREEISADEENELKELLGGLINRRTDNFYEMFQTGVYDITDVCQLYSVEGKVFEDADVLRRILNADPDEIFKGVKYVITG